LSETVRALLRLQQVDGRIRRAQEELDELARKRSLAVTARESERSAAEGARAPLEESERTHRQLEAELADVETALARLEAQVYEVTSKQAFESIQREVLHAREARSALEDRILEQLDAVDEARTRLTEAEAQRKEGSASGEAEAQAWDARERELRAEIARLEPVRVECASGVEDGALRHYDRIRARRWPAALLGEGDSCPGCRIVIAPQTRNDIRRGAAIIHCPGCDRILYGESVLREDESLREGP
jgi:predicted  nucleic acid-binding Zn-ribbon protein